MEFDLLIRGGEVIDGTGRPRFRTDIGILNGKIAALSVGEELQAVKVLDAAGLVVAPGFIDIHSHSDWIFPQEGHSHVLAPLLLQGITTVVAGQCGFSPAPVIGEKDRVVDSISEMLRDSSFPYRWRSFREFLDVMENSGLLMNAAFLVGHGTLRSQVLSNPNGEPDTQELEEMRLQVRQALREGAYGLSAGLAYAPGVFAGNEELGELVRATAEEGGLFTVHGRAYTRISPFYKPMVFGTPHNVRSVRELLGIARSSGARLQLSHQIFVGRRTWSTYKTVLRDIGQAVDQGLDAAFDAFPYTVGNSTIKVIFPAWFLDGFEQKVNDRANLKRLKREIKILQLALGIEYQDVQLMTVDATLAPELEGLNFAEIARRLGMPEFEAYMHIARESRGKANVLLGTYSGDNGYEEPLRAVLSYPLCAFMTDTILTSRGAQNPASFGTFPRILGRYSRDLGLFTMEEAIRRMTSYPAERIGLEQTGRIATGCWADLVLFNPKTIADRSNGNAAASPSGIETVLLSGRVAAQGGQVVHGAGWGRVYRRS